jgi:nitrogen fixation NifU-like protein
LRCSFGNTKKNGYIDSGGLSGKKNYFVLGCGRWSVSRLVVYEVEMAIINPKIQEHFTNPRNMGELDNPTVTGRGGDPDGCGDYIELQLRLENERIVDLAAKVFGCPYAIATTSVFTELIKGKLLSDAMEVNDHEVAEALGGLPEVKKHCSLMGPEALRRAASEYILCRISTPCEVGRHAED